jgi:succinate dehydrogenase / fumarate reductase cytochrome b subunit
VVVGGKEMEDTYTLVADLFKASIVYDLFYVLGGVLLGIHLSHGFWSAFQTLGLNNKDWMKRLQFLAKLFAVIVAAGFSIIPLYFLIKF